MFTSEIYAQNIVQFNPVNEFFNIFVNCRIEIIFYVFILFLYIPSVNNV